MYSIYKVYFSIQSNRKYHTNWRRKASYIEKNNFNKIFFYNFVVVLNTVTLYWIYILWIEYIYIVLNAFILYWIELEIVISR